MQQLRKYQDKGDGWFAFPRIEHDDGTTDDICRACGEWCSEHSREDGRYSMLVAYWHGEVAKDKELQPDAKDDTVLVPICDECLQSEVGDEPQGEIINILGCELLVDFVSRANLKRAGAPL